MEFKIWTVIHKSIQITESLWGIHCTWKLGQAPSSFKSEKALNRLKNFPSTLALCLLLVLCEAFKAWLAAQSNICLTDFLLSWSLLPCSPSLSLFIWKCEQIPEEIRMPLFNQRHASFELPVQMKEMVWGWTGWVTMSTWETCWMTDKVMAATSIWQNEKCSRFNSFVHMVN